MLTEKEIEDILRKYQFTGEEPDSWTTASIAPATHAIAERLAAGVVWKGEAELSFLYPSGKCAIFEGKEISMEIMDSTLNEEPPSYKWEMKKSYRVYVAKKNSDLTTP